MFWNSGLTGAVEVVRAAMLLVAFFFFFCFGRAGGNIFFSMEIFFF